jgi:hypothetical protein
LEAEVTYKSQVMQLKMRPDFSTNVGDDSGDAPSGFSNALAPHWDLDPELHRV